MREGKPPPARPFPIASRKPPQLRWAIIVWIGFIVIAVAQVVFYIMADMVLNQGSPLNGIVPLKSFGAVIMLLLPIMLIRAKERTANGHNRYQ